MTTFLFILVCIIWFLVLAAVVFGGGFLTADMAFEGEYKSAALTGTGTIVGTALVIWIAIATGIITGGDNSEHCGPGTTYRESSRYDPATKTVKTDWVCEVNR